LGECSSSGAEGEPRANGATTWLVRDGVGLDVSAQQRASQMEAIRPMRNRLIDAWKPQPTKEKNEKD
jgi:hypothetical protein